MLLRSYLKSSSAAKEKHKYLFSCSLHHLYGNGIDLVVHLNCSPFTAADFHQQNSKVCPSKVKCQKVSILCKKICVYI